MYKIIFFGTPEFVTPILESLKQNFEVSAVVTAADQLVGRKQVLTPSAIKIKAQELGIKNIFTPAKLKDPEFISAISSLEPDLFIVSAYGKIIPQTVLDLPKNGALNVHPSKLPQYRGASPIQSAILNGDKDSALTIIKMDAEVDHGPIVLQEPVAISDQDNLATLSNKMFSLAAEVLVTLIPDFIEGKVKLKEQDHQKATFCKILTKQDGYFSIDNPPSKEQLDRMIRAYYPWPNAWTIWKFKNKDLRIKIYPAGVFDPTQITLQSEGKKPITLKDFLNGYPDFLIKQL